ncbi:DUF6152 family protein [Bacillus gobiensis]|uniref:DUF6152 family protein n=1 Tax=Bacillus gobiensis TaxID=1441095 RepID=UPI003D24D7AD
MLQLHKGITLTLFIGILISSLIQNTSVQAHHGWSYFDTSQPLYFSGTVVEVNWKNPHPELIIRVPDKLTLPENIKEIDVPPELEELNFQNTLENLKVLPSPGGNWTLILAPTTRLNEWGMPEAPQTGEEIAVFGYISCDSQKEVRPELVVFDENRSVRQRSVSLPETNCKRDADSSAASLNNSDQESIAMNEEQQKDSLFEANQSILWIAGLFVLFGILAAIVVWRKLWKRG